MESGKNNDNVKPKLSKLKKSRELSVTEKEKGKKGKTTADDEKPEKMKKQVSKRKIADDDDAGPTKPKLSKVKKEFDDDAGPTKPKLSKVKKEFDADAGPTKPKLSKVKKEFDDDAGPTKPKLLKVKKEFDDDAGPTKPKLLKVKKEFDVEPVLPVVGIKKEDWLANVENIDRKIASNLVKLFEKDNTIPFIARYRQHLTNGMDAERLLQVKESLDTCNQIVVKAENLLKTLKKEGCDDEGIVARVAQARTIEEIDILAAPFKKASKGTLAARAKEAGLEEPALAILYGTVPVDLESLVDKSISGRENVKKVRNGLQHVIAEVVSKDVEVLNSLERIMQSEQIIMESSYKKGAEEHKLYEKFDQYKNFRSDIRDLKEYQVLAINRGEDEKILTVKTSIPDSFWERLRCFCKQRWLIKGLLSPERSAIFDDAVRDGMNRLISPLVIRQIRSRLTATAERRAITFFVANLRQLLLTPPVRGKTVLAIDPGANQGCKIAVVSPLGFPLHTDKIFLTGSADLERASCSVVECVKRYQCDVIALGNGKFCRETEEFISRLIKNGSFRPLDVSYVIVDEQGVSIYSVTLDARKEFPDITDPTLISAISLGRRLQDPLAELVKIEPKHLGVGMYQHDIAEKKLTASLDAVVSECVSFVGVDVNTASIHLLRRVAGLTAKRAEAITRHREANGPFVNRSQLLKIKGIGAKSYEQCAGFVRILPATAMTVEGLNVLDETEIHPDDYQLAERLIEDCGLKLDDLGSAKFIAEMKQAVRTSFESLAEKYSTTVQTIKQVVEALQKPTDYDLRSLSQAPLFRRGITSIESLKTNDILTGVVRNVTQFGAFVDVGVGTSGLIHSSKLGRDQSRWVKLGDKVRVRILNVDVQRRRIGLEICRG